MKGYVSSPLSGGICNSALQEKRQEERQLLPIVPGKKFPCYCPEKQPRKFFCLLWQYRLVDRVMYELFELM